MSDSKTAHQIKLERLYNKNQLIPRVRREFTECEEFSFTSYIVSKQIPVNFGLDLLVQMALHKRANLDTLVGCLRHHFHDSQLTADMILKCAEADLIDFSQNLRMFIVKFTISQDVQEELDRYQFPLPMVVPPKKLKSNRDIGYLMSSGSVILRNNHHNDDVCLDHLNRVNKIKLTVNLDTVTMVKNKWRNLDKPKQGETQDDFIRRKKAFEKYDRSARDVINLLIQEGNEFYLTHKYDKRGRTYCMGYHCSYQAAPWNKAVLEFSEKEIIQ
jgi:hypothetical protein